MLIAVEAQIWTPLGDGTPLDLGDVEKFIMDQALKYDVQEVLFDPHMFTRSAQILSDQGLLMSEHPQSDTRMVPASQTTYDLITTERIQYDPGHNMSALFARHVANGATTETERGWRVTKRKATGPIDALVAMIMSVAGAANPSPAPGFSW